VPARLHSPRACHCRAVSPPNRTTLSKPHTCLPTAPPTWRVQAVKDVYLPNSGLWVTEYPHADRTQFLEVSLQVSGRRGEWLTGWLAAVSWQAAVGARPVDFAIAALLSHR